MQINDQGKETARKAAGRLDEFGGQGRNRLDRILPRAIAQGEILVAKGGIEPPTRGFSIRCSTN